MSHPVIPLYELYYKINVQCASYHVICTRFLAVLSILYVSSRKRYTIKKKKNKSPKKPFASRWLYTGFNTHTHTHNITVMHNPHFCIRQSNISDRSGFIIWCAKEFVVPLHHITQCIVRELMTTSARPRTTRLFYSFYPHDVLYNNIPF